MNNLSSRSKRLAANDGRSGSRALPAAEIDLEEWDMAETKKGNKIVAVPSYTRKQDGQKIHVAEHRRSTPETSTGKK